VIGFYTKEDRIMAKLPDGLTLETVMESMNGDEYPGFCLKCGEQADGVEPDARRYECESCGANAVYGSEEIVMMFA
jgi:hypothetical protein